MTLDEIDELAAGMGVSVPALDGFDDAIAGYAEIPGSIRIAYDYERCIDILMQQGMDRVEAVEYFDFNVAGSIPPDNNAYPIILHTEA